DLTTGADRAGTGDHVPAGHRPGVEQVEDAEGEHGAGARPADVVDLDVHIDREVEVGVQEDAEDAAAAAVVPGGDLQVGGSVVPLDGQGDRGARRGGGQGVGQVLVGLDGLLAAGGGQCRDHVVGLHHAVGVTVGGGPD